MSEMGLRDLHDLATFETGILRLAISSRGLAPELLASERDVRVSL